MAKDNLNNNPYSKAHFKTMKYKPGYPQEGLKFLEEARKWITNFFIY